VYNDVIPKIPPVSTITNTCTGRGIADGQSPAPSTFTRPSGSSTPGSIVRVPEVHSNHSTPTHSTVAASVSTSSPQAPAVPPKGTGTKELPKASIPGGSTPASGTSTASTSGNGNGYHWSGSGRSNGSARTSTVEMRPVQ